MRIAFIALAALATLLGGCERQAQDTRASNTSVLGSSGISPVAKTKPPANPAEALPTPPAPKGSTVQLTMVDAKTGLALWDENGRIMASRYTNNTKWETPGPLEQITGVASHAKLASNGRGVAMAVWQHTVGQIESLRFSRYEAAKGWSTPDVMPGALPMPLGAKAGLPQLEVDAHGNARAEWRSGFDAQQVQASTYVPGEGWARPVDLPAPQTAQR